MTFLKQILILIAFVLALTTQTSAQENNACITHQDLVRTVLKTFEQDKSKTPEFRISNADDGQSLVYWHTGGRTGSFFAATFKSDGCAVLTTEGKLRRFIFPKTAYNTGVFFELDEFDYKL